MAKQQAFGIDISNFGGTMTPTKVEGMKASGVTFAIVAYQDPDLFEQQCRAIAAAGIKVGAYFFIYWSRIERQIARLNEAIDRMQAMTDMTFGWTRADGSMMPQLWLDFEEDSTGNPVHLPSPDTLQWGTLMVEQCNARNVRTGIYTGQFWWKEHAGNDARFKHLPLWHASQFRETVPKPMGDFYRGNDYGGWPVPMVWQYRGDVPMVGGYSADHNLEEWEIA